MACQMKEIWLLKMDKSGSAVCCRDLVQMHQLSNKWLLKFNADKCSVMKTEEDANRPDCACHTGGNKSQGPICERELGITAN